MARTSEEMARRETARQVRSEEMDRIDNIRWMNEDLRPVGLKTIDQRETLREFVRLENSYRLRRISRDYNHSGS